MAAEHILTKDISAFDRMKAELQQHHNGKFVIFHEGQLEGSFDSFDGAAR